MQSATCSAAVSQRIQRSSPGQRALVEHQQGAVLETQRLGGHRGDATRVSRARQALVQELELARGVKARGSKVAWTARPSTSATSCGRLALGVHRRVDLALALGRRAAVSVDPRAPDAVGVALCPRRARAG